MKKFELVWKDLKDNESFYFERYDDYVIQYNMFMRKLENEAKQEKNFNERAFYFFLLSWRNTAQQHQCNFPKRATVKQFLKEVYDAYNGESN